MKTLRPDDQTMWNPQVRKMPAHVRQAVQTHVPMRNNEAQGGLYIHGAHVKQLGFNQPRARMLIDAEEDVPGVVVEALDFHGVNALVTFRLSNDSAVVLLRALAQALRDQGVSEAKLADAVATPISRVNSATYYQEEDRSNE